MVSKNDFRISYLATSPGVYEGLTVVTVIPAREAPVIRKAYSGQFGRNRAYEGKSLVGGGWNVDFYFGFWKGGEVFLKKTNKVMVFVLGAVGEEQGL